MKFEVKDIRQNIVTIIDTKEVKDTVFIFWVKEDKNMYIRTKEFKEKKDLDKYIESYNKVKNSKIINYMNIFEAYYNSLYTADRSNYIIIKI